MWLSRVRIPIDGALKSLRPVMMPASDNDRVSISHRLLWSLFPNSKKADKNWRPFLWREESTGKFIVLSDKEPSANDMLEISDSKTFAPRLDNGARLRFRLRANPTITTKRAGTSEKNPRRGKRVDIVMDAISGIPKDARAQPRNEQLGWGEDGEGKPLPLKAPRDWLDRQGGQYGFEIEEAVALGYQTLLVPRADGRREGKPMRIGVVELEGLLKVIDPTEFVKRVPLGFGSAKAFGCGLMLIRRA